MTVTILTAAVAAEAVVLIVFAAVLVKLRKRLGKVNTVSIAAVSQMNELVMEARDLSVDLTERLEEGMRLYASMTDAARREARRAAEMAPAPEDEAPAARRRAAKASAPDADAPVATTRTRTRKTAVDVPAAGSSEERSADFVLARQKGMDPLGLAIQRSLVASK